MKLLQYRISSDGGETWTLQWMTQSEAEKEKKAGKLVEREKEIKHE